jgi:transposase
MSMQPQPWPDVPAETARVAKRSFRKGSLPIRVRDELGSWYEDADFAGVYGVRGAPGISPAQLAMVTVLQFSENLTDRQAADELRGRIDWKYCLGLELEFAGFDFSVLSGFRDRLVAGGAERVIFDRLLERLGELGLVGAGGRQRTDSTHVLGRIRDLNRLELAGETVRAALETLAAAVPQWLGAILDASWQQVYGQRIGNWRLPESEARRAELAVQYGRDGYWLLEQVHGPGAPGWLRELPAVQALRRIWIQQYYRELSQDGEKVIRRERGKQGLPPGRDMLSSPYDLDARYSEKHGTRWTGYKTHLTETVSDPAGDDPDSGRAAVPNLITDVQTTHAAVPDAAMTAPVQDSLEAAGLLPGEHCADSGYVSADLLISSRRRGITLTGPLLGDNSAQARSGGYTLDKFTIDWDREQVTCPEGKISKSWCPTSQREGRETIVVLFRAPDCRQCPAREQCTTSRTGRGLNLRPRQTHEAVAAARAAEQTQDWKDRYKTRAGVEGTMHQATHVTGIRNARYTGLPKTRLEHLAAATAINLIRTDDWLNGNPIDRTRITHLQRLNLPAAA